MADIANRPSPMSNDGAETKTKKPYARTMTDKRREQNRRAQKVYREKLKRKLEGEDEPLKELEPAVSTIDISTPCPVPTIDPVPTITAFASNASIPPSNIINFEDVFASAGDLAVESSIAPSFPYPTTPSSPTPSVPIPKPAQLESNAKTLQPLDIWRMPYRIPGTPYSPPSTASSSYMAGALTTVSPGYAYQHQIRRYRSQARSSRPSSSHDSSSSLPSPYANNITMTSESNMSASIAIALSLGISSDAYLEDHPSLFPRCFDSWWVSLYEPEPALRSNKTYNSFMSSPYTATNRRFLMSASFMDTPNSTRPVYNTTQPIHCGLSVLEPACPKFLAASYAFLYGSGPNSPTLVREHFGRIKSPLRPLPIQMLHSHPSYLDCIVFPRFRERAVQASVDGVLDHVEFFLDLMHGGLVCWGASSPHSSSRRRRRRGMAEAVPWSTRSWEARRWFLEKWAWLVGTEEQERAWGDTEGIWGCSRWWWELRGEPDEDDEEDGEDESEEEALRRINEGIDGRGNGAERFDLTGVSYTPMSEEDVVNFAERIPS